jgi:hypothetical protein
MNLPKEMVMSHAVHGDVELLPIFFILLLVWMAEPDPKTIIDVPV